MRLDNVPVRWVLGMVAGLPLVVAIAAMGLVAADAQHDAASATDDIGDLDILDALADAQSQLEAEEWLLRMFADGVGMVRPARLSPDADGAAPPVAGQAPAAPHARRAALSCVDCPLTWLRDWMVARTDAAMARLRSRGLTPAEQEGLAALIADLETARAASAGTAVELDRALRGLRSDGHDLFTRSRALRMHGQDARWIGLQELHGSRRAALEEVTEVVVRLHHQTARSAPGRPHFVMGNHDQTLEELEEGNVWAYPDGGPELDGPAMRAWVEVLRGVTRTGLAPFGDDAGGTARLLALGSDYVEEIAGFGQSVARELREELAGARADARTRRNLIVVVALATGLVVAGVTARIGRRLSGRISGLLDEATLITKGAFEECDPPAERPADELGRLGHSLDVVLHSLELVDHQLRAIGDGDLDAPALADSSAGGLGQRLRAAVQAVNHSTSLLADQALRDHLTGLLNREGLQTAIVEQVQPDSVIVVVDLDGFKAVNDTHGHAAGDEVLQQVAGRLRGVVRPDDVIGRTGGDEFLVLLPAGVAEGPDVLTQRIEQVLSEPMHITSPTDDGPVTVRIGASVGWTSCAAGESPEQAIERADLRMYDVKRRRTLSRSR